VQSLNDQAAAIQQFIAYLSAHAYQFLTAIAAVGVLSMAIIQTIKDMLPVRNWFQQYFLETWLQQKAGDAQKASTEWMTTAKGGLAWFSVERERTDPPADDKYFLESPRVDKAEKDLFRLATDGDDKALYDLPIEQLCGQLNSAAQMVLDSPIDHPDLFRCLASMADTVDVARVMFPAKEAKGARPLNDEEPRKRHDNYVDARTRVTHQIQRAIDALQIRVAFRWKFTLQIASILLSGAIAGIGVWIFGKGTHPILSSVGIAILGGFLAPVARDLVAALQQLRK
jgi:hypothetical protein